MVIPDRTSPEASSAIPPNHSQLVDTVQISNSSGEVEVFGQLQQVEELEEILVQNAILIQKLISVLGVNHHRLDSRRLVWLMRWLGLGEVFQPGCTVFPDCVENRLRFLERNWADRHFWPFVGISEAHNEITQLARTHPNPLLLRLSSTASGFLTLTKLDGPSEDPVASHFRLFVTESGTILYESYEYLTISEFCSFYIMEQSSRSALRNQPQ